MRRVDQHTSHESAPRVSGRRNLCRLDGLWLVACGACLLWGPHSLARDAVDLPQAVQYALLQNRDLIQTRLAIDSSVYALDAAESEFAVEVRPDGSALTTPDRDVYAVGLNIDKKLAIGTEFDAGARYARLAEGFDTGRSARSSVRFQVSQPLLREFGTLVNREPVVQAEHNVLTARRLLAVRKSSLVVSVVRAFEELVRLQHQVDSDEASFARADQLYRLTTARERQGRATRVDVLRVDLQRGQAESRLMNDREQYASRFKDFVDLLGFAPDDEFDLIPSEPLELEVPSEPASIAIAFSNRLDYAEAMQQLDDARRGVAVARKNLWPALRIVGRVEQFGEGESFTGARDLNETQWSIGVEGDADVIQRRDRAALGQRTVDQASVLQQVEIVTNAITREVGQQLLAYERARRELEIAEQNLSVTVDRVRLSRRMFEIGRGDNFSVTDAEDAFVLAERQFLLARANASIVAYAFLDTLGTLIAASPELKPRGEASP